MIKTPPAIPMVRTALAVALWLPLLAGLSGCYYSLEGADREVAQLIASRQLAALSATSDASVPRPHVESPGLDSDAYRFVPHPVGPEVPPEFTSGREPLISADQQGGDAPPSAAPAPPAPELPGPAGVSGDVGGFAGEGAAGPVMPPPAEAPLTGAQASQVEDSEDFVYGEADEDVDFGPPFTLPEALVYATGHARDYQTAKEDLYLQALALSLERHLWTPQLVGSISADYTEFPQDSDPDRALQAVADVAVAQRLPLGGQVVAQWVGTMVRDIERHVTNSESGTAILQADIPLLRGAGLVAFESRFQSERDLVYAVRTFERFRRVFLTTVAGAYFDLLSLKAAIHNAIAGRDSSRDNWERSQALVEAEKIVRQEADRARVDFLQARNRVINAQATYESALDQFKILIGMPTTERIDVVDTELPEMWVPTVEQGVAIQTALDMRLDYLTVIDRVDDARRGVQIARNNMLPALDVNAAVSYTTNPEHLSSVNFREDDEQWDVGMTLELPFDRKEERNAWRASLISMQRAERRQELEADSIRLEVRQALRSIQQAEFSLAIQKENIEVNVVRREAAQARFDLGEGTNRDIVDADNDLREARDSFAQAQAELRQAILEFRLATGTLRVDENGHWVID